MTVPTRDTEPRVAAPRIANTYTPALAEGDAPAPPDAGPGAAGADDVPRGTTPTYELEMLISGTVTFGLLQLPRVLDATYDAAAARVAETTMVPVVITWILGKAILCALTASFLLHLVVRAYWVGLVGLDSVFPRGARRDRLSVAGPVTRDEHLRRLPTLSRTIGRLDNVASTIFSIAFLEVLCVLALGALFGFGLALEQVMKALPDKGVEEKLVVGGLLAFVTFVTLGWVVDRLAGKRLREGSVIRRLLRVRARVTYVVFGVWLYGPLSYTLLTNVRKRVAVPILALGILGSLQFAIRDANRHVGTYLPSRRDVQAVARGDYEALRPAEGAPRLSPTIQSDVVEGPYVKLFVPYSRENDQAAMRRECTVLGPLRRRGMISGSRKLTTADSLAYLRTFECLARVRSVTLDGKPVANLAYRYYQHPVSGTPGVIAYLPTDSLARGMHTLYVRSAPDTAGKPRRGSEIVFWR
jgi:hypothetical protein